VTGLKQKLTPDESTLLSEEEQLLAERKRVLQGEKFFVSTQNTPPFSPKK
jgi:hypothetical protein